MNRETRLGYLTAILLATLGAGLLLAGALEVAGRPQRPLHIGTNLWIGYEPLHLAQASGDLPDTVTLLAAQSTPPVMEAVRQGALDGATFTLDEVMRLEAAGVPMAVVLVLDISHGADMVLARPGLNPASPLTGVRVGVEAGAVGAYMLHRFLAHSNLSVKDVTLVELSATDHPHAFRHHDLDLLVTYEPWAARLRQAGAVPLFDSTAIPGEIVDVLAIRQDRLRDHRASIGALVRSWYDGVHLLKSADGLWTDHTVRRQGLPRSEIDLILNRLQFPDVDRNRDLLSKSAGGLPLTMMEQWLDAEGVKGDASIKPTLLPDFLPGR